MGKKAKKAILPSERREEEDDVYDSEAELEMEALAELEAERQADADEVNSSADSSSTRGNVIYNRSGLLAAAEELESRDLPWIEQLDICAQEKVDIPDVHDDLQRELAFYEMALSSVKEARGRLKEQGIAWKRPDDFFCEMIKSDTQMAKIKDKLIFEQMKMDAFEQRKERQTQKKYAKATADKIIKEKSAAKKDNIEAVDKWRRDNSERRKNDKLKDDDYELDRLMAEDKNPTKSRKRKNLDRKYGFGGEKNKKANRNDPKSLNNTRDFNPKQMKAQARGKGGKGKGGKGKGGARPGKETRDKRRNARN